MPMQSLLKMDDNIQISGVDTRENKLFKKKKKKMAFNSNLINQDMI